MNDNTNRRSTGLLLARHALCALGLTLAGATASATTLDFEALPTPPATTDIGALVDANAGSRVVSGVTFNAADNADWEIVGSGYQAVPGGDLFAATSSGSYALAGNAFSGADFSGNTYTGLTVSTTLRLTGLDIGFDDTGYGANDASSLTITAFGAGGDLASVTTLLSGPSLVAFDTSGVFGSLTGITGYRFETTAADDLDAAYGRAYLIADDISFGTTSAIPEPSAVLLLLGGLALLGTRARRSR